MILINLQKLKLIHSNTSVLLNLNREVLPMLELIFEPMREWFLNCRPGPCNCAQMSSSSCRTSSSSESSCQISLYSDSSCRTSSSSESSCQISLYSDSSCRTSSSRSDGTLTASEVTPRPLLFDNEEEDTVVSMWPLERLRRWSLAVQGDWSFLGGGRLDMCLVGLRAEPNSQGWTVNFLCPSLRGVIVIQATLL